MLRDWINSVSIPVTLPLYHQISELLIRDIAAGCAGRRAAAAGSAHGAELGVAVGTLRKALAELDGTGTAGARARGRATTCGAPGRPVGIYGCSGWSWRRAAACRRRGCCRWTGCASPPRRLPWRRRLARIRRLRFLSGSAAAVEEIWLDARHAESLQAAESVRDRSTSTTATRFGLWIARAEDRIGPGAAARLGVRRSFRSGRARPARGSTAAPRVASGGSRRSAAPGSTRPPRAMSRGGARRGHDRQAALRDHRLRHDGAGASAQHRAAAGRRGGGDLRARRGHAGGRGGAGAGGACSWSGSRTLLAVRTWTPADRQPEPPALPSSSRRSPRSGRCRCWSRSRSSPTLAEAPRLGGSARPIRRRSGWRWNTATCPRSRS